MRTEAEKERLRKMTTASDPALVDLSLDKLRMLRPDLFGILGLLQKFLGWIKFIQKQIPNLTEQLLLGDSRSAVVVSTSPLLVAAYTDELDCVAMLKFPERLVSEYDLDVGDRLLTANYYSNDPNDGTDLIPGPRNSEIWTSFSPIIVEFLTDDLEDVEERKKAIREGEWERTWRMAQEYLELKPDLARDGRPVFSAVDAELEEE